MESCEVASQELLKGRGEGREGEKTSAKSRRKENDGIKLQQPQEVKVWTSCLTVKVT